MRFTLRFESGVWSLMPQDGELAGLIVATAEGVTLTDVTFNGDDITGAIQATWGLSVINDDVFNSRHMIKAIGIGQVFKSPAAIPFHFGGDGSYCAETNRLLRRAAHVMILSQGKFYGK